MNDEPFSHDLTDPDPFGIMLIVLGAAGSVASLAAYIDKKLTDRREQRQISYFAVRDTIVGIESGLNELRGYLKSLEIILVSRASRRATRDIMEALPRFGSANLVFSRDGYERWKEIEDGILISVGKIQRRTGDLLRYFATSSMMMEGDTAERLSRAISKMNSLVLNISQMHFADFFGSLEEIIGECMDIMKMLSGASGK